MSYVTRALIAPAIIIVFALGNVGCEFAPNIGPNVIDASSPRPDPDVEYIPGPPGLPFSSAVRVDNMLYLSGQLGAEPGATSVVEGGVQAETRQTMENIKTVLEENGSSMNQVVKCMVFMADMSQWSAMNEVYVTFFPEHFPARSAFGATALAYDAELEIECMATVNN
jgi:reactive intermediate/imine deaminase